MGTIPPPYFGGRYPGDSYVDSVGVSLFGHPYSTSGMTRPNQVADFADAHAKPMMIAESTPHGANTPTANGDALWNQWFQQLENVLDLLEAEEHGGA